MQKIALTLVAGSI